MTKKIFIWSTVVVALGIALLFVNNNIIRGISMSIIAAYIFYIPIQFIPSLINEKNKLPAKAIIYRKLQLMLVRLDEIFISPYKKINPDSNPQKNMSLSTFYNPVFMIGFMSGFNLKQASDVHDINIQSACSFKVSIRSYWDEVVNYSNEIMRISAAQEDHDLIYLLDYLISDSSIAKAIQLSKINIVDINFETYLGLNQMGSGHQEEIFKNIILLHKIAFCYFDLLKENDNFFQIVFPSYFNGNRD